MDPLFEHNIDKFLIMWIPNFFLENIPSFVTSALTTFIPYTPINMIIFATVFVVVYFSNIHNNASKEIHYCRYNKPKTRYESSIWEALKNSYRIYFIVAFTVNYSTIYKYKSVESYITSSI